VEIGVVHPVAGIGGSGGPLPTRDVESGARAGAEARPHRHTAGAALKLLSADARGAVFVEFIISFIPMFIFFLGITQLSFSYAAKLVVHHAATKAARAAIITEPLPKRDCPEGNSADPNAPRDFGPGTTSMPDPFNQQPDASTGEAAEGTPLQIRARAAAYLPLSTLAPPLFAYPTGADAAQAVSSFGGQYVSRFAAGYFIYNRSHAAVTFRDANGEVHLPEYFKQDEMVTVHVSYLQYCMIPLVNRIMCNPIVDIGGLSREVGVAREQMPSSEELRLVLLNQGTGLEQLTTDANALGERVQERVDYANRVYSELLHAEYPEALAAWLDTRFRFQMIQAEVTLPAQFAGYVDVCQTAEK
jgi:TadE-like protein